jgi:hypothetical protein
MQKELLKSRRKSKRLKSDKSIIDAVCFNNSDNLIKRSSCFEIEMRLDFQEGELFWSQRPGLRFNGLADHLPHRQELLDHVNDIKLVSLGVIVCRIRSAYGHFCEDRA